MGVGGYPSTLFYSPGRDFFCPHLLGKGKIKRETTSALAARKLVVPVGLPPSLKCRAVNLLYSLKEVRQ